MNRHRVKGNLGIKATAGIMARNVLCDGNFMHHSAGE